MTAGTLKPFQLPASLRAVESAADAFEISARRVGSRVYGNPGGLTVSERYILAEKREAHLIASREASIRQLEEQRQLRGDLVHLEKNARRMDIQASRPCGRKREEGRTTHSIVANIKTVGMRVSANLGLRRGDARVPQGGIHGNINKVRDVLERMDHTFQMARVRSNLRAAIRGLHQEGNFAAEVAKTVGILRRCRDDDPEAESPRERHRRRRAATCLQRIARGRRLRRVFQDVVRPALHIYMSVGKQRRPRHGEIGRRALLLARFGLIRAAHVRLRQAILSTPMPIHVHEPGENNRCCRLEPAGAPCRGGYTAAALPSTGGATEAKPSPSRSTIAPQTGSEKTLRGVDTPSAAGGGGIGRDQESGKLAMDTGDAGEPEPRRAPLRRVEEEGWEPSPFQGAPVDLEEDGRRSYGSSNGAANQARWREEQLLLWALTEAAARVVQDVMRAFARRRRSLSEIGPRLFTAPTGDVTSVDDGDFCGDSGLVGANGEGGEGSGCKPDLEGLPWPIGAGLLFPGPAAAAAAVSLALSTTGARTVTTKTMTTEASPMEKTSNGTSSISSSYPNSSAAMPPTSSDRSPPAATPVRSSHRRFPTTAGICVTQQCRDGALAEPGFDHQEGGASGWPLDVGEKAVGNSLVRGVPAQWPLLPSEERKKRRNEIHLRRNRSRARHTERALATLEYQGNMVLPEIVRMQRLFRARRTKRIYEQGQASREAQLAAWKAKRSREREERAARWKSTMSRVKATRVPDLNKQLKGFAGVVGQAAVGPLDDRAEDVPCQGLLTDLNGKDVPYASVQWSLAVAYSVGSWRGGLRQRHYFGRLMSFLAYRRRRKAALRASVEARMAKRLQAWAIQLSEAKRSLAHKIKAGAPAEVVGAHLRFLARMGTWERLLLDFHDILEKTFSEREHAVGLLWGHFFPEPPGAPGRALQSLPKAPAGRSSPAVAIGTSSLSRSSSNGPQDCRELSRCTSKRKRQQDKPGRSSACELPSSRRLLAMAGATAGEPPEDWTRARGRRVAGSQQTVGSRSRAEAERLLPLREVVDDWTLRHLHPWIVSLLGESALQFVPSVPQKARIGYRVDDAEEAEVQAEKQLTRRYWKLLGGIADAVSLVAAAKVEAAALVAEAGEWALLLGFAHDLTSKGLLDPPCALPKLPRRYDSVIRKTGSSGGGGAPNSITKSGLAARQPSLFLTPVDWQRTEGVLASTKCAPGAANSRRRWPATEGGALHVRSGAGPHEAEVNRRVGGAGSASTGLRWISAERGLCENCWALRTGDSAAGGSTCQRCGQMHRRGFSQLVSKSGGGDGAAGPIPWQRFGQVGEPVDLFVVHAAFACVLHPGRGLGASSLRDAGGLGWWSGGTTEEAWWRAVCGGKRAARNLRTHGCDTIGKLYAYVRGAGATSSPSSSSSSAISRKRNAIVTKKVRARTEKLRRLVQDEDLAVKISSMLLMLMSALEKLRTQNRWPAVSESAVHHAMRELQLPCAAPSLLRPEVVNPAKARQNALDWGRVNY